MQQQQQNPSSAGPNHPPQGPHPPHSDNNNDGMQWAAPQMQQQQQWGGPNLPRQQNLASQPLADPGQEVEMTDVRKVSVRGGDRKRKFLFAPENFAPQKVRRTHFTCMVLFIGPAVLFKVHGLKGGA